MNKLAYRPRSNFAPKQAGWTLWSLFFVLSVLLFFSYVGMQLVPVYAENGNVKNAMSLSLEDVDLRRVTRAQIIRSLNAQLYLDGSHKVVNYKTDLKIRRSLDKILVEIRYRREIPLFFNLSLVASFNNIEERRFRNTNL